jgi:hypothetical protein
MVVAFRRHTQLPTDDCLYALQPTIPHMTRSSLHRCLQRHGISRLPEVEGEASSKCKFRTYPIGSSTSTSPKCRPRKASSISSSRSTEPRSSRALGWSTRPIRRPRAFLQALVGVEIVLTENPFRSWATRTGCCADGAPVSGRSAPLSRRSRQIGPSAFEGFENEGLVRLDDSAQRSRLCRGRARGEAMAPAEGRRRMNAAQLRGLGQALAHRRPGQGVEGASAALAAELQQPMRAAPANNLAPRAMRAASAFRPLWLVVRWRAGV